MKRRRGLTLVELLVVMASVAVLILASTRAYVIGLDVERRLRDDIGAERAGLRFERAVASLLEHAYLSPTAGDPNTFFVATFSEGRAGLSASPSTFGGISDLLVFTAVGTPLPADYLAAEGTFEDLNAAYGPQGGLAEIEFSLVPFDAPAEARGLFVREQRPADGDPSQGGFQRVLEPAVTEIGFEFFDGVAWRTSWDTRTTEPDRLPAAVRVRYRLNDEEDERVFVVRLPNSDVTPDDPVTVGGGE